MNLSSPLTVLYNLSTTGKVIQRLFIIDYIHSWRFTAIGEANGKSSTFTIK